VNGRTATMTAMTLAALAALLAVFVMWAPGSSRGRSAQAATDPSVDFSISSSGCNSSGLPTATCTVAADATFSLAFNLNSLPGNGSYVGYDSNVSYTSGLTTSGTGLHLTGSGNWPDCVFNASDFSNPGLATTGCSLGLGGTPSTYTGSLYHLDFACRTPATTQQTITILHGAGLTDTLDDTLASHSEAADETLTITCGAGTPTPCSGPCPTATPTNTPTPTVAREAAIVIGSGTATEGELTSVALQVSYTLPPGVGYWMIDVDYGAPWVSPLRCSPREGDVCNPTYNDHTVRVVGGTYPYGLLGTTNLATIVFLCNYEGVARLSLSVGTLGTVDFQPITPHVENGSITCLGPTTATYTPTDTPTYTPTPTPTPQGVPGDVNCNEQTDAIDAALILQYSGDLIDLLLCPQNGDVNRSGGINAIDAALILQYVAGLIQSLGPT
jgi:hypothetical protein